MNLTGLDRRQTLCFVPYVPKRIRQDVFVGHEAIECRQIATFESVTPGTLHLFDFIHYTHSVTLVRNFYAIVGLNVRNRSDELQTLARNVSRYLVIALKLAKRHVVAAGFQVGGDLSTATIDWQDVVVCAV
jgi:hypothetical protein